MGGFRGDAEGAGGFVEGAAGEVAEFDQALGAPVELTESPDVLFDDEEA
jgi:hypothetical protein